MELFKCLFFFHTELISDTCLFAGFKIFDKRKDNFIHADEINVIFNHHVPEENTPLILHPRATHNLLGYSPDVTTLKPRTSIKLWADGEWPE